MGIGKKEKSINLIPEDQREGSVGSKFFPLVIFGVIILIELVLFTVLFLLSANNRSRISSLNSEISTQTTAWHTHEPVATMIKSIKAKKTSYEAGQVKYTGMDNKLEKIRKILPEGVSLTTLAINNDGKVSLTGKSQNPDDAYQFYNILNREKDVTSVSLDSVSKPAADYAFTLNFILNTK